MGDSALLSSANRCDPTTLLSLASRVEAGEGPDRELDAEIYHDILGFCRHANTERSGAQSDTGFDCLDCGADSWGNKGAKGERLHDAPPAFTASLDAAAKLIPADPWLELKGPRKYLNIPTPVPNVWSATISRWNHEGQVTGWASTPARALTAACLRARAIGEAANG